MHKPTFETYKLINGPMHQSLRHDSAHKHVAGSAEYIDDIPEPAGLLHGAIGMADRAHAEILSMDLSAVKAYPGVVCVLTASDVPGVNDVSSGGRHDEPLLAVGEVHYLGQPVFVVVAESHLAARRAARLSATEFLTDELASRRLERFFGGRRCARFRAPTAAFCVVVPVIDRVVIITLGLSAL